ncbi:hypothetical protein ALC57_05999 [Trachymyrmex cornetzi]|uniref:Uncharacterized protein n=1 Tax=Trachymyrmex cornetzi TaxID=471704 RepID=A0A151J9J5_9HYME|nr:hypothetical protein ALC57_05999 [Trachymyrmex cornetzi]
MSAAKTATDDNDDDNNNNNKNDDENDEDRKGDGEDDNEDEERKEDNENDNVRRGQMINRICGDSEDCAFGRQTNPANPCIIRSSLETLNMLPGESNGENAAAGERRSRAEIVSHIQEASITRAPARSTCATRVDSVDICVSILFTMPLGGVTCRPNHGLLGKIRSKSIKSD